MNQHESMQPGLATTGNPVAGEYLVSHGQGGALGRFVANEPLDLVRGDRVVIQTARGLEIGKVLRAAGAFGHQAWQRTSPGQLLRRASTDDDQQVSQYQDLGRHLFGDSRRLARELDLPLEILDVEILLDGRSAFLHYLSAGTCDAEPLIRTLAEEHHLAIFLESLATPVAVEDDPHEEEHGGCGEPGCGRASGGGCTSCGSGGGCSSCGSGKVDMREYFSHLRSKMGEPQRRPLL